MKFYQFNYTVLFLILIATSKVNAELIEITRNSLNRLPSSPIIDQHIDHAPLSCLSDFKQSLSYVKTISEKESSEHVSLKYLNKIVKADYTTMRNKVISHVTQQVALSLFDFTTNGFAAENIARFVSEGTRPYLPFQFANGVKITKVTPQKNTIVYRAEMPITKNHTLATLLTLSGKAFASSTICDDMKIVDDLLGRDIIIQYDYYDSNGEFFSSFAING